MPFQTDASDKVPNDCSQAGLPRAVGGLEPSPQAGPAHRRLHELFEAQATRSPNAVAVTFEGRHLTYRALDARANQLAHWLRADGIGIGTPVAFCLESSLELIPVVLGILKAGGAYLPLDPAYPAQRLADMLADAEAPVLITQRALAAGLPPHPARVLLLDDDQNGLDRQPTQDLALAISPEDTAYIIYTSGSTGRPKGCCVTHRNVTRLFTATEPWFGFDARDVWTLFHSCAFDFSVWEIWGALLYGGRLVVVPRLVTRSPADFLQLLAREGVTVLNQTPSAFRQLLAAEAAASPAPELALRYVIFGGEALELRRLQPWFVRHGDQRPRLVNMYGITETTVHVTYRPLTAQDLGRGSVIGIPIPDLQVHILDAQMKECAVGEPGEIFVGGAGVARGYLRRPELTAARFVPSPFAPCERLYRSGDLAVRLPDGDLQYLGRIDQQVKIRGYRVELGEIESALLTHPAVREAAVLARDADGAQELVACLVWAGEKASAASLRAHLGATLPDYMVPAIFVAVDHIPLTINGKADRQALLGGASNRLDSEVGFEPPRTPLEAGLAEIWQAVLGRARVGRTDHFFAVGGHSLHAMQVAARASRLRGAPVPVPLLFEQPVLADFARAVGQLARIAAGPASFPAGTEAVTLSPMQQGMLLDSLREPGAGVNLEQICWRMPATVDRAAFLDAWRWLTGRHDALRTAFRWEDLAAPAQEVCTAVEVPVREIDWRASAPEEFPSRWREFLAADRATGFNLRTPPLWRLALIDGPNAQIQFLWTIHHAIIDGRSLAILLRELTLAYAALCRGERPALPAPPPYREFVARLAQQDLAAAEAFWRDRLAGSGPLPRFQIPPPPVARGATQQRKSCDTRVPAGLTVALRQRAKSLGATPNTLMQAAWALLLGRWTGARDVVFGATRAGRRAGPRAGTGGVGVFINTLPLRAVLNPADRWETLVQSLRRQQVEARGYEHTPLALIQHWCARGQPLFETFLMFERFEWAPEIEKLCAPLAVADVEMHEAPSYPLSLSAYDGPEPLLRFHYDARRFAGDAIARMQVDYRRLLEAALANPDATIGDLLQCLPEPDGTGESPAGRSAPSPPASALPFANEFRGDALGPERTSPAGGAGQPAQPLSAEQQRLWFLDRTIACRAAYNVPLIFRLRGPVDLARLEKSLQVVAGRHDILRTRFIERDGEPVQERVSGPGPRLELQDLRGVPAAHREARVATEIAHRLARPFDLGAAPPWQVTCLQLGDEEQVLALVAHHIICDEWSLRLWVGELEALYPTSGDAGRAQLPELAAQYGDYAVRQRVRLAEPAMELQRDYWRTQLAGLAGGLELPFDHARPARPTLRGGRVGTRVPGGVARRLQAVGQAEGATWFMVWLAAWQALLARLARQEDVVVATPLAQREQPDVEALIGFFLNTVPLRARVECSRSFRELLRQVRQTALDSFLHGALPFNEIVRLVPATRQEGFTPLAQVMLVLNQDQPRALRWPGIESELLEPAWPIAKFDVTLFLSEAPGGDWRATLEFSLDLFEPETATRMLAQFVRLLESIAAAPEASLATLELLPEAERQLVLQAFNDTGTAFAVPSDVHVLFEEQARRTPAAAAVSLGEVQLSYGELDAQADRLAKELRGLGVGPDALAGLCLERSPLMIVAILGVLKAGGACLPLDPEYPAERLRFMLEDARPVVLISQASLLDRLPQSPCPKLALDVWRPTGDGLEQTAGGLRPEHLAYVLFTSGSTGRPKGVAMSRGALLNLISWQAGQSRCGVGDRTLQFASLSFDVSFQEVFATLCTGGTLVLVPERIRRDLLALTLLIRQQRVARLFLPFVVLDELARGLNEAGPQPLALREVITAGEQLRITPAIVDFFTRHPGVALVNQYGPTETHVVTAFTLAGPAASWPALPPIGRPIANAQVYVLGEALQPVPVGVVGELCVGGVQVARGYLNRPQLTSEKFVPDPFSTQAGARIYRTGDRCRWLKEGVLEFLGRRDDQVKVRGFRIELGEIEAVLARHPAVQQAAVVGHDGGGGATALAAFVVARPGAGVSPQLLREHLRALLPEHMVPAGFALVDRLPLTPNGKVDRLSLARQAQDPALRAPALGGVAPRNAVEALLAAVWEETLGRRPVGVRDDFFELGGHSLLAMALMRRIAQRFGRGLPLASLFAAPTIEQLARLLEAPEAATPPPITGGLRGAGKGPPLFHVPGIAGYEFLPEAIARRVGVEGRFYDGLEYPGLDGKATPLDRVEAIAAHMLAQIRRVWPTGAVCLSGHSFGGVVAYEVARQLHSIGVPVEQVLLWDSFAPRAFRKRTATETLRVLRRHLASLDPRGRWVFLARRTLGKVRFLQAGALNRLQARPSEGAAAPRVASGWVEDPEGPKARVMAAALKAYRDYRPGPYAGALRLFQVEDREFGVGFRFALDPYNGWKSHARGHFEVLTVPGDHHSMLKEPAVSVLADKTLAALRRKPVSPA